MEVLRIRHVQPLNKTPPDIETGYKALRSALWLSLYHAQTLELHALEDRLLPLLRDTDRLLQACDLQ